MRTSTIVLVILLVLLASPAHAGQSVVRQPQPSAELARRWAWATEEAARRGATRYWVGYSITKMMPLHSFTGSFSSDEERNHPTLAEVLAGSRLDEIVTDAQGDRLVPKEIALLFLVERGAGGQASIRDARISNVTLHVELGTAPLYWLEGARDAESIALLRQRYAEADLPAVKDEIVQGIGMHEESASSLPFLSEILKGTEPHQLRSTAATALGRIRSAASLSLLAEAAEHDESGDVRDRAVYAIGEMDSAFGLETLIRFARDRHISRDVRTRAIYVLAQIASAKTVRTLTEITERDDDAEIQRQALYALTQTNNDGIDAVIAIAKSHPNRKLRRDAIYWLAQSEDPRALETLLAIIRQ